MKTRSTSHCLVQLQCFFGKKLNCWKIFLLWFYSRYSFHFISWIPLRSWIVIQNTTRHWSCRGVKHNYLCSSSTLQIFSLPIWLCTQLMQHACLNHCLGGVGGAHRDRGEAFLGCWFSCRAGCCGHRSFVLWPSMGRLLRWTRTLLLEKGSNQIWKYL